VTQFPFLGTSTRIYTQYLDVVAGRTLTAEPGGSYEIAVTPMYEAADAKTGALTASIPVPPADGAWGPAETAGDDKPAAAKAGKGDRAVSV
jgi:hypothetical protein